MKTGFTTTAAATAALLVAGTGVAHGLDGGTAGGADYRLRASGQFAPSSSPVAPAAITYDHELVPPGAGIKVTQRVDGAGTTVAVSVRGVAPDHTYGVHVHTAPCGADPDDAGPHYQNREDPEQPSVDPAYANPANEVWLDFTTDGSGAARSVASHPWNFRMGEARSVVLHEHATSLKPGEAGMAGERVGCFTVPLMGDGVR
ncbi:superoxide dismutase family protein [Streptomyces armeniacus]|uniref:Superoxide dismutase family protein n=1 Tax=Streptomyces armeniacus TaxID=83291 RepID=A0A345XTF1_9ACTN|nr:superoxide dismutase family protein [Streptomyces armeniacus]AXK34917.1 superoxide dismutase family protein [Streptomyces armeniacus]